MDMSNRENMTYRLLTEELKIDPAILNIAETAEFSVTED